MLNLNEVKKDLYKSKNMAKFSHYVAGNLYYTVELANGIYQFPIATTEDIVEIQVDDNTENCDTDVVNMTRSQKVGLGLSSALGTTSFYPEMKGSELNKWISKAIENEEMIKVG